MPAVAPVTNAVEPFSVFVITYSTSRSGQPQWVGLGSAVLIAPGDHVFEFGEVVPIVGGMNLAGEQGDSLGEEGLSVGASRPMDGAFDLFFVTAGLGDQVLEDRVLAAILRHAGEGVPNVGVPGDDRQRAANTHSADEDRDLTQGRRPQQR